MYSLESLNCISCEKMTLNDTSLNDCDIKNTNNVIELKLISINEKPSHNFENLRILNMIWSECFLSLEKNENLNILYLDDIKYVNIISNNEIEHLALVNCINTKNIDCKI